ncbi:thioredoxin [Flavivirga aquatica]|uniref:Thioredoxin n=1 Tax=Flavivirga aquatica TaxID=1849968 RepID=A0A1E5SHH2_9FLAO|nr:thioredoxin [Flavivirga aquatica]OEJ98562.1 thioredoxin [Flavivirga aquatica]
MKGSFKNIINCEKPVLVDFHAEWCGPCKAQGSIINEVAKETGSKVRIIKIDIDKNPKLSQQYQIRSVPTIVLFKDGKLLWKQSGVHSKQQLHNIINQYS